MEEERERCAALDRLARERDLAVVSRQGSREVLRRLFDLHKDRVYGIALRFLGGDAATAEDVTQEVFLRLSTRLGQYRSEAEFTTYLYRLVVNACIDERRRVRRLVPLGDVPAERGRDETPSPEEVCQRRALAEAVDAALAEMKPELRLALLLKYFDDLSYQEMARALGCSEGTVASRLHRGLKALGRRLAYLRPSGEGG